MFKTIELEVVFQVQFKREKIALKNHETSESLLNPLGIFVQKSYLMCAIKSQISHGKIIKSSDDCCRYSEP